MPPAYILRAKALIMDGKPVTGEVIWIGVRPERRTPLAVCQEVQLVAGRGIKGDHYDQPDGDRQVTLVLAEDLQRAAADLGREGIDPALVRRNLVIRGIDLHASGRCRVRLGDCLIELTGDCHPCNRMDENLGDGGRRSLADRGGFTGRILVGGVIQVGDPVSLA